MRGTGAALLGCALWGGLALGQVPDSLTISSGSVPPFQANQTIVTSGNVTVAGSGAVTYSAGVSVDLKSGFHATATGAGVAFRAFIAAPYFTISSVAGPVPPVVAIGQTVTVSLTFAPYFGFATNVTPVLGTGGSGLTVTFSPAVLHFTGSTPVTVVATIAAGTAAATGLRNVTVQAGSPSVAVVVPVTVQALPNPVISLESPVSGTSVFGAANFSGYAVENTPALPNNKVTAVSVSIAANDGSGVVSTGPAVYGQVPRNDLCAGAGLYVGAPNCPKLQFDYLWNTGLAADGVTFVPNGIYTATVTATGAGLSSAITPTFTVDNQPPSPLISSPVNGNGDYNTYQTFVVDFVSPHNVGDIGSGQTSV